MAWDPSLICNFDAAIFDLDGVLVDSQKLAFQSLAYGCERQGEEPPDAGAFFRLMGLPLETILEELSLPPAVADHFRDFASRNSGLVSAIPGALKMVADIRATGCKTAVLTGKDRLRAVDILSAKGFGDLIELLVTPDDEAPKPNPDAIWYIAAEFDVKLDRSFYIGDSATDMLTARQAGVTAIFASWGANEEISARSYDFRLASPGELVGTCGKRASR